MAGPPNIGGVGAEFTAEGVTSAKPNISPPTDNTSKTTLSQGQ
jgi:hypothetical protein